MDSPIEVNSAPPWEQSNNQPIEVNTPPPFQTASSDVGRLESLGVGAASAVPVDQIVANAVGKGSEWQQEKNAAWEQHPGYYGTGKVAGLGALGAATGGLGEAAGLTGLGGAAIEGGAIGGLSGVNMAAESAKNGDILPSTEQTLKSGALGAATGAITGTALEGLNVTNPKIDPETGEQILSAGAKTPQYAPSLVSKVTGISPNALNARYENPSNILPEFLNKIVPGIAGGSETPLAENDTNAVIKQILEKTGTFGNKENISPEVTQAAKNLGFTDALPVQDWDTVPPEQQYNLTAKDAATKYINSTNPNAPSQYQYNQLRQILPVEDVNAFNNAQQFLKPNIPGATKQAFAAGLAFTGHPYLTAAEEVGALGEGQAGLLGNIGGGLNKVFSAVIGQGTGKAIDFAASPYGKILSNALQQGGMQGLASMHYVLATTQPQYAQQLDDMMNDGNQ